MNSTNLINAIDDTNLYGDCLIVPLRSSVQAFRNTVSVWPANLPLHQKIFEIFKKAIFLIALVGASPLALIGIVIKWIDLALRINQLAHKGSAISYYFPKTLTLFSRLGDHVVAYLNAKYIAEKHDLPIYFKPFKGCDIFNFSQQETFTGPRYFKKVVYLDSAEEIEALEKIDKNESTLYILPYFPFTRNLQEESPDCKFINYATPWESFRPRVGELLKVIKPYTPVDIPNDAYSIALHIRDGGAFDTEKTKTLHPLKLPCMNFYLGELKRALTSTHIPVGMPVFIHIFTDAVEPEKIYDIVQASLSELDLQGRKVQLSYKEQATLTDDIANMSRFQCMIRADSNLSGPIAAGSEVLEHEIFPTHVTVDPEQEEVSIRRVRIVTHRKHITNVETDYSKKMVTGGLPQLFITLFHNFYGVLQTRPNAV